MTRPLLSGLGPVEIVGYHVLAVDVTVPVLPPGKLKTALDADVSKNETTFPVPKQYLEPNRIYEFEVLATEKGGNQIKASKDLRGRRITDINLTCLLARPKFARAGFVAPAFAQQYQGCAGVKFRRLDLASIRSPAPRAAVFIRRPCAEPRTRFHCSRPRHRPAMGGSRPGSPRRIPGAGRR